MRLLAASRKWFEARVAASVMVLFVVVVPAAANELQEANRLLKSGQHQEALRQVDKALSATPGDPQARFLKGVILAEQGQAKAAADVFQKLTQDYPELPEPYNNLAVIYASQGEYERARQALEKSIRTHPSYATAYENLGDVYSKLASEAYERALKLDASNAGAQKKLAMVRELTGTAAAPVRVAAASPVRAAPPASNTRVDTPPRDVTPPPPAPTKPVAAAVARVPATAATSTQAAARDADGAILDMVAAWAKAWSAQDVDAYLAFYAPEFKTPRGEPRADWESTRRARVGEPRSIAVSVRNAKVLRRDDGRAAVVFIQRYRSERFEGSTRKTLELAKGDAGWRIIEEVVK